MGRYSHTAQHVVQPADRQCWVGCRSPQTSIRKSTQHAIAWALSIPVCHSLWQALHVACIIEHTQ